MKELELSNGLKLPMIGLGANGIWGGEEMLHSELAQKQYEVYCHAMNSGKCELYDTSGAYGYNEKILGEAIKDTNSRSRIKIMSKVSNRAQREHNVRGALENSLKTLGTDYLDVYLIHWPQMGCFIDTYLEMEKLYEEGLIKAIGVANCNIHHLEEIMQCANIVPMVNQFELHPLFTQDALVNYCYAKDIKVIAYTPIARMHDVLIKGKPVFTLAKKYNRTPVQIILRWHYQNHRIAIPCTKRIEHFEECHDIFDFSLDDKEMAWISSMNGNIRLRYDPDNCDFLRL